VRGGPKGGGGPLLAWACLQLALGTMLALWGEQVPALLFLAGAIPLLLLSAWNRVRPPSGNPRLLARVSVPVVVLAFGTAVATLGATAGLWLFLIGAEIGVFALVWLLREIVVERRTVGR
jgi:hypothetical protein